MTDGKKPSLAKLLQYGIDPNALSVEDVGERRTLLCLAIEEAVKLHDVSKVDLLLEAKADPDRKSENGTYPLQLAVKAGHVALARKLLHARSDANMTDDKFVTPLHTAVHADHPRIIQLLLLHKANINACDKVGQPPFFFARSKDACVALIEGNADIVHLNKKGQGALHLMAHNGAYDALSFLTDHDQLRHMVDLQDERGRTALHHAAARVQQGIVSRLLDVGADPRIKTNNGQSAMTLADAKDTDLAYYIYIRTTGGNKSTWREMASNPIAMTLAAIMSVACFLNRRVLWEFGWDLADMMQG